MAFDVMYFILVWRNVFCVGVVENSVYYCIILHEWMFSDYAYDVFL